MKSRVDRKVECPCCDVSRAVEDTPLLATETRLEESGKNPFWGHAGWSVEYAKSGRLQWACTRCLQSGQALAAQPWVQTFCDHAPYFAFFDVTLLCGDCQQPFVFAGSEQRYWFETLLFWVQSRPKQCITCRRARRERAKQERARQQERANIIK